jgi:hypothetical protein
VAVMMSMPCMLLSSLALGFNECLIRAGRPGLEPDASSQQCADYLALFGIAVHALHLVSTGSFLDCCCGRRMLLMSAVGPPVGWGPPREPRKPCDFGMVRRRSILFLMILESLSPAAINGGTICTLHNYFPRSGAPCSTSCAWMRGSSWGCGALDDIAKQLSHRLSRLTAFV